MSELNFLFFPCKIQPTVYHHYHRRVSGPRTRLGDETTRMMSRLSRGSFLERPGNLTGPESYFEIKVSRKVGCVMTSNELHFVYLAHNFTVQFLNVFKVPSGMENKTA